MCGITAIYNRSGLASASLRESNSIVCHRGPDDEGYLLWRPDEPVALYRGEDTALSTQQAFRHPALPDNDTRWTLGLGHRRLSIIDLSPGGHQPMMLEPAGLAISFNGEIFNYIEVRRELETLGHHFLTGSDTEVILHAWSQWGKESLHRLNGMFAFFLLDTKNRKFYAVRDRFGVKPVYFSDSSSCMAFASEVKQLRALPGYSFFLEQQIAYDYLRYGLIDHATETFEKGVFQLLPGHVFELDMVSGKWQTMRWYQLVPTEWRGTERDAAEKLYELLKDSVRLRLRSDVPVGSALSGGVDSSIIVCLMRQLLGANHEVDHPIRTITSCYEEKKYDEREYAAEVIQRTHAEPHYVYPSFEKLQHDFVKILWHMDYPFGSTSQFSQWCVFEGARQQGLTVMIDGQGADEQFAGYGGNDLAFYAGLLKKFRIGAISREVWSYYTINKRWPTGFLLGAMQVNHPALTRIVPSRARRSTEVLAWLHSNGFREFSDDHSMLRNHLMTQISTMPLPALLRYEDRNSMAFSVESRVPFMDYRLIEFTLGLPEDLVYRRGERKYILRKAFRGIVPDKILDRKDKMGFVSPEEFWVKGEGWEWFNNSVSSQPDQLDFINHKEVVKMFAEVRKGTRPFDFTPWRFVCLYKWLQQR